MTGTHTTPLVAAMEQQLAALDAAISDQKKVVEKNSRVANSWLGRSAHAHLRLQNLQARREHAATALDEMRQAMAS